MPDQESRQSLCDAAASSCKTSGWGQRLQRPRAGRRHGRLAGYALLPGCFAGLGQLHCPGLLLAGIDFEKAGPVEATSEAVSGAPYSEFLVARAHERLARPFAATVIIDRIDIIEARSKVAAKQRLAVTCRKVPPAFGRPTLAVLVAQRDADATFREVADTEISSRGRRHQCGKCNEGKIPQSGRRAPVHYRAKPVPKGESIPHWQFAPSSGVTACQRIWRGNR